MKTIKLQNNIIRLVLKTQDDQLLKYLNQLLSKTSDEAGYSLTSFEKQVIKESLEEYKRGDVVSNEEVFDS